VRGITSTPGCQDEGDLPSGLAAASRPDDQHDDAGRCRHDLLVLFVRNQLRVSLALPLIAVLFAVLAGLSWTSPAVTLAWLGCVLACQGVQLWLCRQHQRTDKAHSHVEWIGNLTASETLLACCWSLPLYIFWEPGNYVQHISLIGGLLVVIAVRILIAGNFMPVVIAGTGLMTIAIVVRCIIAAEPAYLTLAAMAVVTEIFFIQLARRLQETSHEMLIFKAERERLIGELQEAMDQTEAARAKAEEANRAKSRFLATMSHELRTPLNAIMGFSEVLSTEMMGPHAVSVYKEYSHDIHHSGHYLLSLINDILDLSRIEAGRLEIEDEPVLVGRIGRDCAELILLRTRQRRQELRQNFPTDEPLILGGERSIRQIWLNLLSNAIKFTPDGGTLEMAVKMQPCGALSMSVSDNGPGIPAAEIESALGAFTRGAQATRTAIDGAGLGLPIVHGLAKLYGAELAINSTPGQGTEVVVTFPPTRVVGGPETTALSHLNVASPSQRRLIAVTA
jgi:two-component system cell cycle sensor histidine kinase PleC